MILHINTNNKTQIVISLKDKEKTLDTLSDENKFGSQVLLPLIEKLLKKNNKNLSDLTAIEVENSQGSYTGLRVGVSVANALGYSLKIPVNGKDIETDISYE